MAVAAAFRAAERALLVPDLLAYWLTGAVGAEVTNASTTGLLGASTRQWAWELIDRLGLPRGLFPPLTRPGDRFAYVSCGTWSLVGWSCRRRCSARPAAGRAGFTNELGVDGTVRYLRNVMGLWLLQESLRSWQAAGLPADLTGLLHAATREPAFAAVLDCDDDRFLPPGDMPARIAEVCRENGQTPPASQAATVRCILDSLALAYRRTVRRAAELSGRPVDVVHLVGGGARNALLCQLTADACGLPVVAGPAEAAALGNALVQARAGGAITGGLPELRALLRETQDVVRYTPTPGAEAAWAAAEARVG